ncbi:MAG: nodulation protein NfeD [Bacteroidales bacterium]|jgi:membrane-bound serine protease (ClpP class)|nr:nodulation protein NfeD [Bacteroidales bacterium]
MKKIAAIILLLMTIAAAAQEKVLVFRIFEEIDNSAWIHTQSALDRAEHINASRIVLHLNTYGGEVVYADSIRSRLLNSRIPIYAFIDGNAASAGALISIACDSIYMTQGSSIGAATVVSGADGSKMPDKYQSYFRSKMRATAEAHGCDTIISGCDTTLHYHRNPIIAEAMVDEAVVVEGIVDSLHILTFTTNEAIKHGYCEGVKNSVDEVANEVCRGREYTLTTYEPSVIDNVKGSLGGTALRGILILIIVWGIYFEIQTPGLGFPSIAAVVAALLYFTPLYIDGLVANWEVIIFIVGVALMVVEVFVIPGFGVAGVSGIVLMVTGLAFGLIDNDNFDFSSVPSGAIGRAFGFVSISMVIAIILCILLTHSIFKPRKNRQNPMMLNANEAAEEGFIGTNADLSSYIGCRCRTFSDLRPSGKVEIDGKIVDAISHGGAFISINSFVVVDRVNGNQVEVSLSEQ